MVEVVNFGCRLNAYEGEIIRGHAAAAGLDDAPGATIVINTCAVTAEAVRQARQAIRKARRDKPHARILVTGCAAQIDPASFAAMTEVDQVLGNEEKLRAATYATTPRIAVGDIMSVNEMQAAPVGSLAGHTRGFLQIQQGCDHRCTFCVIPLGRGNNRSLSSEAIVSQARAMVDQGIGEIVLTGVDIGGYGSDAGHPSLGGLVRDLFRQVPDLPRLRLSSIDPVEIDDDLWRLIAEEPRLMPHLHLSLQSGDDLILKRMKRRHSRADAVSVCGRARDLRPDIAFGADLIAGFPTEDEAMFQASLGLVAECGLDFLHVFAYSPRPGTPAARMPQVPGAIRKERAARLRAAGDLALSRLFSAMSGTTQRVLVEAGGRGHAENFAPVEIDSGRRGEIASFRITGQRDRRLTGERTAP